MDPQVTMVLSILKWLNGLDDLGVPPIVRQGCEEVLALLLRDSQLEIPWVKPTGGCGKPAMIFLGK